MREFFGLVIFIILLSIWSMVFANGGFKSKTSIPAAQQVIEIQSVQR